MIISSKKIILTGDRPFNVVVNGNTESKKIIILVHGFGVRSESRGLFTSIENEFKNNYLTVRPDFAEMEERHIKTIPFSSQVNRLQIVLDYLDEEYPNKNKIFIGHSQGSIIIAMAKLSNSQVFLLAPPLKTPFDNFIKTPGWKYPGSNLNLEGESRLVRSDKTLVLVEKKFWDDFRPLDALNLYRELLPTNDVDMILAGDDNIRAKQMFPQGFKGSTVEHADHDFKEESRSTLLKKLKDII